MQFRHFFNELKRRDVFRVAAAYTVTAWLLIQVIVSVFPYLGIPDYWITVSIVLLILGFPISVIAGWVYELTPDGVKKTGEVELTKEQEEATDRKLNMLIISFLSLALLFLVIERLFFAESALIERDTLSIQTASIAVLPFVDMSQEQDQEYFSDGLSEELLNVLAKVEGLQVAGRTSSFQYKGQNLDLREVGDELGVDHLLEGSVRKFGDQIRVTAQLIKAEDGFHLWSETYDRAYSANNLFQIQDDISQRVLQELEVRLLPEFENNIAKDRTQNILAYDYYLQANKLVVNRNADDIGRAVSLYQQAIEEDTEFAAAYARLAIAYSLLNAYGNLNRQEMLQKMRLNTDRALLLDPDMGWAYAALGEYHRHSGNIEEAHTALKKAHELIPGDPEIMIWYAQTVDSWKLRDQLILRAYDTDPLSPLAIYHKAKLLYDLDEFADAIALMEKNLEINPDNSLSLSLKAEFIKDQPFGDLDESFILAYQAYEMEPGNLTYKFDLAEISFDLGFLFLVDTVRTELRRAFPENFSLLELNYDYHLYTENYDSMEVILDEYLEMLEIDPSDYELFEIYQFLYLNAGRLEDAERYINQYYPEIPALTLNSDEFYMEDLVLSAVLYERIGKTEISQALTDMSCEIVTDEFEFDGNVEKEIIQVLMDYMDCAAIRGDKDVLLNILEEIHFERKSKANIYTFLDTNPALEKYRNDPDYRKLRQRMQDDILRMSERSVNWLKANGHWQEDWEVTEQNY